MPSDNRYYERKPCESLYRVTREDGKNVRHNPIVPPPAVYDSLSAQLLGDPPIGRRAIDRRQGGPSPAATVHLAGATYDPGTHVAWHLDMRGRWTNS